MRPHVLKQGGSGTWLPVGEVGPVRRRCQTHGSIKPLKTKPPGWDFPFPSVAALLTVGVGAGINRNHTRPTPGPRWYLLLVQWLITPENTKLRLNCNLQESSFLSSRPLSNALEVFACPFVGLNIAATSGNCRSCPDMNKRSFSRMADLIFG